MSEKTGGYINRLVVTCLRSGLNRTFRTLQKPERAPIRALRASSSGRFSLLLNFHVDHSMYQFSRTFFLIH